MLHDLSTHFRSSLTLFSLVEVVFLRSGWSCVVVSERTTTVLFRTTFTRTIKLYLLLNIQRVAKHWIPLRKFYLYVQKWNNKKILYIIEWFKISCQTDMKFTWKQGSQVGGQGDGQKLKKQRWVEVSQVFWYCSYKLFPLFIENMFTLFR